MTNTSRADSLPRVLLIDPFVDETEMYAEYLRVSGFAVDIYRDASDGLGEALRDVPDVVVTRLRQRTTALDGLAILRRLKEEVATRRVPVVMITTSILPADRAAAAAAACDTYLLLPVSPLVLVDELRKLLRERG